MDCPNCGAAIEADAALCTNCGFDLHSSAADEVRKLREAGLLEAERGGD